METTTQAPTRHRGPGWRHMFAAIAATAVLTSGMTAYASHQFSDVPNSNVFHDDVDWLADAGITGGFADGTFRPNNPVTRAQAASFFRKAYDLQAGMTAASTTNTAMSINSTQTWTDVPGTSTTITVPPGTQARAVVEFTAHGSCEQGTGIFAFVVIAPNCQARIVLGSSTVLAPGAVHLWYSDWYNEQGPGDPDLLIQPRSGSTTAVSNVLNPGTYTFKAQMLAESGNNSPAANRTLLSFTDGTLVVNGELVDS